MNATYKVVYNKARGALMVVNEMTSCIRSKGTKTVAAAAVAAMIAGLSGAAAAEEITIDTLKDTVVGTEVVDNAQYSIAKQIGTLTVNDGKAHRFYGYNDAYNLQITNGQITILGGSDDGYWADTGLGGYAETIVDGRHGPTSANETLVSGANTTVTITRGNLFGGLYTEDTQGTKLRITNHATVSLAGTNDKNAGVLFAAKGIRLLVEDGAKVEVPASIADNDSYGVINSRDTVFDGATLEVASHGTLGIVAGMNKNQNTESVFAGSSDASPSTDADQNATGLLTLRNSTFNVEETGRVLAKNISIKQTGDKAASTIAGDTEAKDYAVEGGKLSIGSKGSLSVESFTQTAGKVIAEGRLAVKDNLKISGGRLTFAYQHDLNQIDAKTLALTGGEVVNNGVFVIENVSISNAAFNNKSQLCTSNINLEAGGSLNSEIEDKNLQFNELNLKQGAVLNLPNANSKVGFQDAIELKHGKLNLLGGDLRVAGNRHYGPVIINGPSQLDSGSWAASLLVAGNYAFTDIDIRKGDAFVGLQNPATDMLEALTHPGRLTVSNLTVAQGSTLAVNENSALTVTASAKNAGTIPKLSSRGTDLELKKGKFS